MCTESIYVPAFRPGLEDGVVEADESVDSKDCIWWPCEALDKNRYPYYASLRGRAFLPYVMVEGDTCRGRYLVKEPPIEKRDSSWNAIREALNNDDNW